MYKADNKARIFFYYKNLHEINKLEHEIWGDLNFCLWAMVNSHLTSEKSIYLLVSLRQEQRGFCFSLSFVSGFFALGIFVCFASFICLFETGSLLTALA